MDSGNDPINALVSEISSNIPGSAIGFAVSFYLPPDWHARINERPADQDMDYFCDVSRDGGIYLIINCDEIDLDNICLKLTENNLSWIRHGLCYRTASNGHQYQWYIRMEEGISAEAIGKFFRETLGILSAQERMDLEINKWIALNEDDLEYFKRGYELTSEELDKARKQNEKLVKKQARRSEDYESLLKILLPEIQFLGDSLEVVSNELEDPLDLIKRRIYSTGWRVQSGPACLSSPV